MVCSTASSLVQLLETDVVGVLSEALTAQVEVVLPEKEGTGDVSERAVDSLPDETVSVSATDALPRSLAKLPWAAEPNVVVTHDGDLLFLLLKRFKSLS